MTVRELPAPTRDIDTAKHALVKLQKYLDELEVKKKR